MNKKSAWNYCRIDAPEDIHGALKGQYERLETYAEQMGFTVVGSSQDLGSGLNFDRPGLQAVLEAPSRELSGSAGGFGEPNRARYGKDHELYSNNQRLRDQHLFPDGGRNQAV